MCNNRLVIGGNCIFAMSNKVFDSINCLTSLHHADIKFKIMNTLRNKVQLIGNLGNDPEVITLESGKKLAKFAIATNESYKNTNGEKVTDTQWHNIVAWGKTADIIEKYVSKGKEIAIEGKLTSRSYETKDGEKRYITEVVCNELLMLGK